MKINSILVLERAMGNNREGKEEEMEGKKGERQEIRI